MLLSKILDLDAMVLSMVTINTNGLISQAKRRAIFKSCRDGKFDFCFLQETHSSKDVEKIWRAEWGGQIYFSHGTTNSRGVAILVKRGTDCSVTRTTTDVSGRCIIITISKDEQTYLLANIYAPTQDHPTEQTDLIDFLEEQVMDFGEVNLICGGDFNLCMNTDLDRASRSTGNTARGSLYKERVLALMETLQLSDAWRQLHPKMKRFSFRRGGQASRLDYWLVSQHLLSSNSRSEISNEPLSDHEYVSLQLGSNSVRRGPGVWRFDNSLLEDEEIVRKLSDAILEAGNAAEPEDDGAKWEWIKFKVRFVSMQIEKERHQKRKGHEQALRKRLTTVSEKVDNSQKPNEDDLAELSGLRREIKEIELADANRSIRWSRANWTANAEKPTKYFLNLQKIQAKNKIITELIDDQGRTLTQHSEILEEQKNFYQALYNQSFPEEELHDLEQIGLTREMVPTLSDVDRERLDRPYSSDELTQALHTLNKGKCPGTDGLTVEFYEAFWGIIRPFYLKCIRQALVGGCMTVGQRRGMISLI